MMLGSCLSNTLWSMATLPMRVSTESSFGIVVLVRHSRPHSRYTSEIPVKPLDPVCGIDHRLYLRCIVEIRHICLVVGIVAEQLYGPVTAAPYVTHLLPLRPCRLNGIVTLPCTENIPEVSGKSGLVSMPHLLFSTSQNYWLVFFQLPLDTLFETGSTCPI